MNAPRVYLDSNVPMYAAGRPHPLRDPAVALLRAVADNRLAAVTGAEVLQEILHRFHRIGALRQGLALCDTFHRFMEGHILPTTPTAVVKARRLLQAVPQLHVRDALHVAVMETHGIDTIVSADQAFARVPQLRWIPLDRWEVLLRGSVSG